MDRTETASWDFEAMRFGEHTSAVALDLIRYNLHLDYAACRSADKPHFVATPPTPRLDFGSWTVLAPG